MQESIFAVGDIHGCHEKLERLLDRLPVKRPRDTLVFLGDYLDRGREARKVLDVLCGMRQKGFKVIALMGNHEYLLLEYHKTADPGLLPLLRRIGIEKTLESYGDITLSQIATFSFLPEEHREFLFSLLPYWQTDEYLFVHAGLNPLVPLEEQTAADLFEIREPFLNNDSAFGRRVIFGHTPFATPYVTANKIGIDTGAVYGNLLTAVQLPAERFFHA
jgi:serine/threonine protein phosphatase 1